VTAAEFSTPLGIYWDLNGGKPLIWCYGIVAPLYLTSSYPTTNTLYWQPDLAAASYWSWEGSGYRFGVPISVMNLEQTAGLGVLDGNIIMGNLGDPMDFQTVFFLSSPPMYWVYAWVGMQPTRGSLMVPTSSVYELVQVNFTPGATLRAWVTNDVDFSSTVSCNRNVVIDDLEDNGEGIIFVDRRMYLAYNTEAPNEVFWQSTGGSKFMIEGGADGLQGGDGEVWNSDYTLTMGMLGSTVVMAGLYTPGLQQITLMFADASHSPLGGAERPSRPQRTLGASQPVCPSTIRGGVGRGVPLSTAPAPECTHVASTSGGNLYFCSN